MVPVHTVYPRMWNDGLVSELEQNFKKNGLGCKEQSSVLEERVRKITSLPIRFLQPHWDGPLLGSADTAYREKSHWSSTFLKPILLLPVLFPY